MMSPEEKVLEGLKAIRDYCDGVDSCDVCFFDKGIGCLLYKAILEKMPEDWNLSPVEEAVKEGDDHDNQ